MSKTIEDIATAFIKENRSIVGNEAPLIWDVVEYVFEQPLADRLTDVERERIRNLYLSDEEINGVETAFGNYPVAAAKITHNILESIFGKEMFQTENK